MASHPESGFKHRLAHLSTLMGFGVAVAGLAVLGGWAFDIPELTSLLPGLPTMKANTAAAFVLGGASLWLSAPRGGATPAPTAWLARTLAVVVGLLGLLTLAEYGFGWHLGIDQILFDAPLSAVGSPTPGRMAVMTAVNFTLLAAALLLLDVDTRGGRHPSNWLALAIAANSLLAILGYLYDVDALYRVTALTSVALHTALLFVLASLGVVCARPATPFIGRVAGGSPAGLIIRRLLPAAIVIPPFLGWLDWQGILAGYYSPAFGMALFAASNVAVFAVLIWLSARALQRSHDRRIAVVQTSDWQQAMLNSADFTVISTDTEGTIRTINAGVVSMLGYSAEELVDRETPAIIHDPAEVGARAQALSQELGCPVDPGFEAFVAKARRSGSDENDWTYIRKDGSRFTARVSVTALTDARGTLTGFLGIGKDIGAQKLAEQALRDSERRMRLIADSMPALVAYIDHGQHYQFVNSMNEQVLEMDSASLVGRTLRDVLGEAVYAGIVDNVVRALAGEQVSFELRRALKDGEHYHRITFVPDAGPDGDVRGFFAMAFDITDLREGELRLAASEARLRAITDAVPALISYIDLDRRFRFNNATHEQWLGRPLDEIIGQRLDEVYDASTYELMQPHLEAAFKGDSRTFEFLAPAFSRFVRGTFLPDADAEHQVLGVYGLIDDITQQKGVEEKLRQLAQFDSLTGLANRNRFDDKLAEGIARSERNRKTLALMFLDLDHFKAINDCFGHHGGDLALQEFAKRLSGSVRATDTVARLAGDEFVVILELLNSADEAGIVAAKIVAAVRQPFQIAERPCEISTSIGIAVRRAGEVDGEALLARADTALYQAKNTARGGYVVEA